METALNLIETAWENYRKYVLFDAMPGDVAILQVAFYAGARAAIFAVEIGDEGTIAAMARELNLFTVHLKNIANEGEERNG
jgi:hypothetical protein